MVSSPYIVPSVRDDRFGLEIIIGKDPSVGFADSSRYKGSLTLHSLPLEGGGPR